MRTVLIAQRDEAFAEGLAAQLRSTGFRVITCPGPWPAQRCIRCDVGYCPLTETADAMIYDPELTGVDRDGRAYNLAVDSANAHPDVPLLLAWPTNRGPSVGTLRNIRADVPRVRLAARSPEGLDRQLHEIIAGDHPAG
jgi:hypothetical protein